jgi:DNA replication protein DnaC
MPESIEVTAALKGLRLYGMAAAWADLNAQGGPGAVDSGRWLIEHLLQAEATDRAVRSVNYQMGAAKFPAHRDLASFEFESSKVDRALVEQLADMAFTELAHNAVFIGGPGTGKTHLSTAIGMAGITRHGKRVRFYSTVDLVNALEREKAEGRAGRIVSVRRTHLELGLRCDNDPVQLTNSWTRWIRRTVVSAGATAQS